LFQLLQASQRVEGHGIGTRGLTGQTYEGHYFWDTEIYVLPFLIYSEPRVARALLKFPTTCWIKRAPAPESSPCGGPPSLGEPSMARENLRYAAQTVRSLEQTDPEAFEALARRTGLAGTEPADWKEAAERMYLPYDERLGVHPQDDHFLDQQRWDFAGTPEENYPLLLHYHPLNLYRSQVIKQADTVLAMFLLSDQFTAAEKKRNFDYYAHDARFFAFGLRPKHRRQRDRLSAQGHAVIQFRGGDDLSDIGGNMMHGAHIASIGGTWLALIYGFAGIRDHGGHISFEPRLPEEWSRLSFPLTIKGRKLRVEVDHSVTTYSLVDGEQLTIYHNGQEVALTTAVPTLNCQNPAAAAELQPAFADR
jgi:alpha,alpha-trehalose phosphorylase